MVGRLEVEDAEVGDDAPELVVRAHPVAELGGAVVADAAHDVDLLGTNTCGEWFGIQYVTCR